MQSGCANTRKWVIEFAPEQAKRADTLMGWIGSGDMQGQIKMKFATKEQAVAYAEKHGLSYQISEPKLRRLIVKSYADNFRFDRIE